MVDFRDIEKSLDDVGRLEVLDRFFVLFDGIFVVAFSVEMVSMETGDLSKQWLVVMQICGESESDIEKV